MANSVLVIDDDPQFNDIITKLLQHEGFAVDEAYTQKEAISIISKKQFDVILQDVFFPNKDQGLSMLKQLYESIDPNSSTIILMTSMPDQLFSQEPNVSEYLQMAKKFVSKGDDQKAIIESVKEIILAKQHPSA